MVQKLRHLWGRVEIRVLVLLVFGFLLAGLALAFAQLAKSSSDEDPNLVSSWDDLVKQYLDFREHNYALVVPGWYISYGQTEAILKEYSFEELQKEPDWYWTFNEGVYVFEDNSPLAKQIKSGTQIIIYEDMAQEELVVLSAPEKEGGDYTEEIVYTAPKCPEVKKGEDYEQYLFRELSQRRLVWQVTLKSKSLAEEEAAELAAAQELLKDSGEGGGMMLLGMEEYSNHLWVSIQGPAQGLTNIEIAAHIPSGFTNRIEIFTATNLLSFWWTLAETNVLTEGTDTVYWAYQMTEAETGPVFFVIGNADIDSDGDGIKDAREKFLYHTDPSLTDTDGDGIGDGVEVQYGTDPTVYDPEPQVVITSPRDGADLP